MVCLEFLSEVNRKETRVIGQFSSKDHMIVAQVILTQRVADGRTDRRAVLL